MPETGVRLSAVWESRVEAFDAACGVGPAELGKYLPDERDAAYWPVLVELVRIDLEYAWKRGEERRIESYRARFPQLFARTDALRDVAYEEYRLRRQAGEEPTPAEYEARIGMPIGFWPRPKSRTEKTVAGASR